MLPKPLTILLLMVTVPVVFGCRKHNSGDTVVPKQPVVPPKPSFTANMGGMRNWHGWHSYHAYGMHFPTPIDEEYAFHDTSFALTIVNDSTVQIGSSKFKYQSTDTARGMYYFGDAYYYQLYGAGEGIMYFHTKDSILYCNGDRHGTSDSWTLSDTYYTY